MSRFASIGAAVLALGCSLPAAASETAFVNVNVVAMTDDTVQRNRTVVVRDGRIAVVGPVASTAVAADAAIVDGTDRFLMPGLAEMHAHVPGAGSADLARVLTLFAVNGVTSVRGMLGQASHLGLRQRLAAGELLGPRLHTSGPSFNGNSVDSPRQAADMVRAQHRAGYDFLKIHPGLTRAEFEAMARAAGELGMRFAGHVPDDVGLTLALELGISTIDHLDGYMQALVPPREDPSGGFGAFFGLLLAPAADVDRIDELARATLAAGVANVPTQTLFEHRVGPDDPDALANWPEMRYVTEATLRRWVATKNELLADPAFDEDTAARAIAIRRQLIRSLHDHGAELLLGSDAPQVFNVPGFSIHRELALLVECGLTPYQALLTGTVNAARWFGSSEHAGTVEAGKQADLVLLDENPLDDIANTRRVHGVMLGGRWLDRPRIDALLARYAR